MTRGYALPSKHVIHTVGPVWRGGQHGEAELLANCYQSSLQLAVDHGLRTIAFPAISTGIYGYPLEQATRIAVSVTTRFLAEHDIPESVTFVCFGQRTLDVYQQTLRDLDAG